MEHDAIQSAIWSQLASGFQAFADADIHRAEGRYDLAVEGFEKAARNFHVLLSPLARIQNNVPRAFADQALIGHFRAVSALLSLKPTYILEQLDSALIKPADYLDNTAAMASAPLYSRLLASNALSTTPAPRILKLLINQRAVALVAQLHDLPLRDMYSHLRQIEPINPILLASAVAASAIECTDAISIMSSYVSGAAIAPLEADWLQLDFPTEEERTRVLELEREYVDAFTLLSIESLLCSRYGMIYFDESYCGVSLTLLELRSRFEQLDIPCRPEVPYDHLQYDKTEDLPRNWLINAFDIHLHAWVLANPLCIALGPEAACSITVRHGFRTNSAIHNARELVEYELDQSHKCHNEILAADCSADEKGRQLMALKVRQQNLDSLLERSRRLYFWNPMEAHAKASVGRIHKLNYLNGVLRGRRNQT